MLEILNAPKRYGDGIMGSSAYRGTFCYISGFQNAAADVGGNNGLAILKVPYTSVQAIQAKYLVDKLYFSDDYNDTSDAVDKLTTGMTVRYFDEGEFISNKVGTYSFLTSGYIAATDRVSSAASGSMYWSGISATALGVSSKAYWVFVATGPGMGRPRGVGTAGIGMGWLIGTASPGVSTSLVYRNTRAKAIVGRVLGFTNGVTTAQPIGVRFRIENPYAGGMNY